VDLLHSANLVVSQAILQNYMYYSRMDFAYKPNRTTVTVGAPNILSISTSPASAGASSSASAATDPSTPVLVEFWPVFFGRCLRRGSTRRLLCHLRHGFFYGGG
jgi:hypothetical protein